MSKRSRAGQRAGSAVGSDRARGTIGSDRRAVVDRLEPRTLLSVTLAVDTNPTPLSTAALGNLVGLNDRLVFTHDDGRTGAELYVSDGSAAGTRVLKDIRPGATGSSPASLTAINGRVYFTADDGQSGREAWVTDGTAAGTRRLADLSPGAGSSIPHGYTPTPDGTGVYFFATPSGSTGSNTYRLYRTDGTTTAEVKSINAQYGYAPSDAVRFNGSLYFLVGGSTGGGELWRSDGTPDGTRRVQAFPTLNGFVTGLTVAGERMFFSTEYKNLYVTDGSDNGATLLATIGTGGTFSGGQNSGGLTGLRAVGDRVYFAVNDNVAGNELWAADATRAWRVKDIQPGSFGSSPTNLVAHDGKLYFVANDPSAGTEVFVSDGTEAGTGVLADIRSNFPGIGSNPVNLASVGGRLWFGATGNTGSGLFTSDGTTAGTVMVKQITGPAANRAGNFAAAGGSVYFTAGDNTIGAEVWKTSATAPDADNTAVVKDVYRATDNAHRGFIGTFGGRLYYFANDGSNNNEPWFTDGTPGGSGLLKNIHPSGPSIPQFGSARGQATSQYLFFPATDGTTTGGSFQLWRTDGTRDGTIKLTAYGSAINSWATVNDKVYFTRDSDSTLYTSDGTATGTRSVTANFGLIHATLNNVMYTTRHDATFGTELWRSDGTAAGTYRVTDINPGSGSSAIDGVTAVGNQLFFFASNSSSSDTAVYRYVPATNTVTFVKNVLPGRGDYSDGLGAAGGKFFWSATDYSTYGEELYVSDGTAAGTGLVKDINPVGDSRPSQFIELNGQLIFRANDTLWRSDGTAAGTTQVSSILPESSSIRGTTSWAKLGGHVYMSAGAHGFEGIWRTDGKPAGTMLVASVDPGGPNYNAQFAVLGDALFFNASDGVTGHEVWRLTPEPAPLALSAATYTPGHAAVLRFDLGRPLSLELARTQVSVLNRTTNTVLPASAVERSIDPANGQLLLSFPGYPGGLPDADYRVTLLPGAVTDTDGDPLGATMTYDFFSLAGDFNRDRVADFADLGILLNNYNTTGKTNADGDANGDGSVDFADLGILLNNYNKSLIAPATSGVLTEQVPATVDRKKPKKAPIAQAQPAAQTLDQSKAKAAAVKAR